MIRVTLGSVPSIPPKKAKTKSVMMQNGKDPLQTRNFSIFTYILNRLLTWYLHTCIVYFLSNIHAFPIGQSPYNRSSCGWSQCRIKCINIKTQMDWPLSPGKERIREHIFSCACRLCFLLLQLLDFVAVGPGTLLIQQISRLFLPESYLN